jgi:c-di-AMP phosphodiesterase-like protein
MKNNTKFVGLFLLVFWIVMALLLFAIPITMNAKIISIMIQSLIVVICFFCVTNKNAYIGKKRTAYICGTSFIYELGEASETTLYSTPEDMGKHNESCGIFEVEIMVTKVLKEPK